MIRKILYAVCFVTILAWGFVSIAGCSNPAGPTPIGCNGHGPRSIDPIEYTVTPGAVISFRVASSDPDKHEFEIFRVIGSQRTLTTDLGTVEQKDPGTVWFHTVNQLPNTPMDYVILKVSACGGSVSAKITFVINQPFS